MLGKKLFKTISFYLNEPQKKTNRTINTSKSPRHNDNLTKISKKGHYCNNKTTKKSIRYHIKKKENVKKE